MDNENIICPVCGEGSLEQKVYADDLEYNGVKKTVNGFLYSVCDTCGSEVTSPEQSRNNKRLVLETRKQIDGLLTSNTIRGIRRKYQITQQEAATIFGGGASAFSKYENGDVIQSTPMDRLLRVVDAVPGAFNWLARFSGVPVKSKKEKRSFFETREGVYAAAYKVVPVSREYKAANHNLENIIFTEEKEKYETEPPKSESLSAA